MINNCILKFLRNASKNSWSSPGWKSKTNPSKNFWGTYSECNSYKNLCRNHCKSLEPYPDESLEKSMMNPGNLSREFLLEFLKGCLLGFLRKFFLEVFQDFLLGVLLVLPEISAMIPSEISSRIFLGISFKICPYFNYPILDNSFRNLF